MLAVVDVAHPAVVAGVDVALAVAALYGALEAELLAL